jgi:hypothetical protein
MRVILAEHKAREAKLSQSQRSLCTERGAITIAEAVRTAATGDNERVTCSWTPRRASVATKVGAKWSND